MSQHDIHKKVWELLKAVEHLQAELVELMNAIDPKVRKVEPISLDTRNLIKEMASRRYTVAGIAKKLNVSQSTVRKYMK